jgi:tetratricopeptide (TPR) repeat protein
MDRPWSIHRPRLAISLASVSRRLGPAARNDTRSWPTVQALRLDPENTIMRSLRDEAARKAAILELQRQGEAALKNGDNESAVALFLQALAMDPDNAEIKEEEVIAEKRKRADELKREGNGQMASGNYGLAREKYEAAIKLNPADGELTPLIDQASHKKAAKDLQAHGREEYKARAWTQAVAIFDKALAEWPESSWPDYQEIQAEREAAFKKVRAYELLQEALRADKAGNYEEAVSLKRLLD